MRVQAKTIVLKKQLIPTQSEFEFLYKHFNEQLGYAKIKINSKRCTCHKYFDKGICKHLVAACLQVKISLSGLEKLSKKLKLLRRKKRNQYRDIRGDEIDLALEQERPLVQMPIAEAPHQETEVRQGETSQAEVHESENQVHIGKKRGWILDFILVIKNKIHILDFSKRKKTVSYKNVILIFKITWFYKYL
jgi:hypothetical protein